jgi:hypothetical protein
MLTRRQILSAIRSAARKLGRAPTRAEFMRLSGIHYCKLLPHFPGYRDAIRAAGLAPAPGGLRIDTTALLTDWARLARKKGRVPTREEYDREGRYASASLEGRFQRWSHVPAAFLEFIESAGLAEQWPDVLHSIHSGPMPTRGGGRRWLRGRFQKTGPLAVSASSDSLANRGAPNTPGFGVVGLNRGPSGRRSSLNPAPSPGISVLPPPLRGKRCVTVAMLAVLFSASSLRALVPRRIFPDRPLLGPPLGLPGFMYEPANEMGVILLFGMLAWRLGFIIESAQAGYPDCQAKLEVDPGRWQHVRIEFEYESRQFRSHRHDPLRCDIIVCWRHNWSACPPSLQVIELREVVRQLSQSTHLQLYGF